MIASVHRTEVIRGLSLTDPHEITGTVAHRAECHGSVGEVRVGGRPTYIEQPA